jgi:hypothetical protein
LTGLAVSGTVTTGAHTVNGTLTASTVNAGTIGNTGATLTGTLSTAAQPNVTSIGILTGLTVSGTVYPTANASVNLGTSTNWFNTIYGTAIHAQYADLAESYLADAKYEPGTVVVFGGTAEITQSTKTHDPRLAGVVSTDPAYLMNSGLSNGTAIALTGRIPCKVVGPVAKGDCLTSSGLPGVAGRLDNSKWLPGVVIGKSLEDHAENTIKVIEISVGKY